MFVTLEGRKSKARNSSTNSSTSSTTLKVGMFLVSKRTRKVHYMSLDLRESIFSKDAGGPKGSAYEEGGVQGGVCVRQHLCVLSVAQVSQIGYGSDAIGPPQHS